MGGVNVIEGNTAVNCDLMELGLHDAGLLVRPTGGYFGISQACALLVMLISEAKTMS